MDSTDVILRKIESIAKINDEIINRINSKTKLIKSFKYYVKESLSDNNSKVKYPIFEVKQEKEEENVSKIISEWKKSLSITKIDDVFNDNINFSCKYFNDIIRLNKEMVSVSKKYRLFGETEQSKIELNKFKNNYEVLQTGLGEIELTLIDTNSDLEDIINAVGQINNLFKTLGNNKDVNFGKQLDNLVISDSPKPI